VLVDSGLPTVPSAQDIYDELLSESLLELAVKLARIARSRPGDVGAEDAITAIIGLVQPRQELAPLPLVNERLEGDAAAIILRSPEARRFVADLHRLQLLSPDPEWQREWVADGRAELRATVEWLLEIPAAEQAVDVEALFSVLLEGVQQVHDELGLDRLSTISRTALKTLLPPRGATSDGGPGSGSGPRPPRPSARACEEFQQRLREVAGARFGRIESVDVAGRHGFPLTDLYTWPRIGGVEATPLTLRALERSGSGRALGRVVVLGAPGSGKTTFARAIAHRETGPRAQGTAPLFVAMRAYAAWRTQTRQSLVEYLEFTLPHEQMLTAPSHMIRYLLESGRAFVVFDGLDEVSELDDRRATRDAIDELARGFPSLDMLITARTTGYALAPLDGELFDVVALDEFDDDQAQAYVERWFRLTSPDQVEAADHAAAFWSESATVNDLRQNPLLLSLMCGIYRARGALPRNRAAIYERCTQVLFDTWDRSRAVELALPRSDRLQAAVQHLAQWMITQPGLEAGVSRPALVDQLSEYLYANRFEDHADARRAAEEFVDFCRGRSWVFTDIGASANGEPLLGFTHRAFLEFYAASWYAANSSDSRSLAETMLGRVVQGEWETVALLAFAIRSRNYEDAGNELAEAVLGRASECAGEQRSALLSFATAFAESDLPRPSAIRALTMEIVSHHLAATADATGVQLRAAGAMSRRLIDAVAEIPEPLVAGWVDATMSALTAPTALAALDLLLSPRLLYGDLVPTAAARAAIAAIERTGHEPDRLQIETVAETGPFAARIIHEAGLIGLADALELHDPALCFTGGPHPAVPDALIPSVAEELIWTVLFGRHPRLSQNDLFAALHEIGRAVSASPPPWRKPRSVVTSPGWAAIPDGLTQPGLDLMPPPETWSSAQRLAMGLLIAGSFECLSVAGQDRVLAVADTSSHPLWVTYQPLVREHTDLSAFVELLEPDHRELIRSWPGRVFVE
jgi:hypothetical protein